MGVASDQARHPSDEGVEISLLNRRVSTATLRVDVWCYLEGCQGYPGGWGMKRLV